MQNENMISKDTNRELEEAIAMLIGQQLLAIALALKCITRAHCNSRQQAGDFFHSRLAIICSLFIFCICKNRINYLQQSSKHEFLFLFFQDAFLLFSITYLAGEKEFSCVLLNYFYFHTLNEGKMQYPYQQKIKLHNAK